MRRMTKSFMWLIPMMLIAAMLSGNFTPISNAMNDNKGKTRAARTTEQRLERVALRFGGDNPMLPVLMHAMERYVKGTPAESDIDRAFRGALAKHPNVNAQKLQGVVDKWNAIPESTKSRLVPTELRSLNFTRKLNSAEIAPAMRRYVPPPAGGTYVVNAGAKVPQILAFAGSEPGPKGQDANGYPRIYPGGGFLIDAANIPSDKTKIKIHFLKPGANGAADKEAFTIAPEYAGGVTITARMPGNLPLGDYKVAVEVIGVGTSETWWGDVTLPNQNLPAAIKTFEPAAQYPGSAVTITGLNIPDSAKLVWKPADATKAAPAPMPISATGTSQADFTIPQTVAPGKYYLTLVAGGAKISKEIAFTVRAPLYRVKFSQIKCVSETDGLGKDEIVTTWVVDADGKAFEKHTGVYEGFFDNAPPQNYLASDATVFPMKGNKGGEVRDHLSIGTSLMEWDAGDAQAATEALDAIGSGAMALGELFGPIGAAIGAAVKIVLEVIGALVSLFGGDPDPLGVDEVKLTAADLQKKTAKGSFSDTVQFANYKDDSYHYMLFYTITREQPQ